MVTGVRKFRSDIGIHWRKIMFEILKRQEMADGTVVLNEISAPLIAKKAKPGQFVILKQGSGFR